MKNLITVVCIAIAGTMMGQRDTAVDANNNTLGALASFGPDGANVGGSSVVFNPPRPIEGSVHLFDEWDNNGVIVTAEDQKFKIRNINFNAKRNTFESQMSKDSVFTFDYTNLDRIVVNNRIFKNVYNPIQGGYKVMEMVAESDKFSIYKDYVVDIKEGNPNPMLVQNNDKYVIRDSYYIKRGRSFKKFKFKKSNLLKLMGKDAKQVAAYAKENNLSFKEERDVYKIVTYYAGL